MLAAAGFFAECRHGVLVINIHENPAEVEQDGFARVAVHASFFAFLPADGKPTGTA